MATPLSPATDQVKPPRYLMPNSYQIISPGRDGIYGRGTPIMQMTAASILTQNPATTWSPSSVDAMAGSGNFNFRDDQSNFNTGILGAP
jgi:hypothetical protein